MSFEGLVMLLLMSSITAAWVFAPMLQRRRQGGRAWRDKQRARATLYYERVLTNVRDLDEDHATGKVDDVTYHTEREKWTQQGMALLKLLDALDQERDVLTPSQDDDAAIDAAIETLLAKTETTTP